MTGVPLRWSIEDRGEWFHPASGRTVHVFVWQCLVCESATGQAPTYAGADEAASIHWRANHNHHQETRA